MSRVNVNIDRLVLRGVDPAEGPALVNALKAELTRTMAQSASGWEGTQTRSVARVRETAPARQAGLQGARQLGVAAARAIGRESRR